MEPDNFIKGMLTVKGYGYEGVSSGKYVPCNHMWCFSEHQLCAEISSDFIGCLNVYTDKNRCWLCLCSSLWQTSWLGQAVAAAVGSAQVCEQGSGQRSSWCLREASGQHLPLPPQPQEKLFSASLFEHFNGSLTECYILIWFFKKSF